MTSEPQASTCRPVKPERVRVAIIEDNAEIADLYVILVRTMGMSISFLARDGAEAVRAFARRERTPDVLLIDHRMPVMSGLDAMKEILAMDRSARFVFISADEGVRDEALAAGAKAFLRKPASTLEICETLDRVLNDA